MTNETDIRKAVLVAVAKKYQKFNDKNPIGQEILDRTLVRYDPVSDEFHPNDTGWIDSQQAYYKLKSATLRIDPAAFDKLCEGNDPSASNVHPTHSRTQPENCAASTMEEDEGNAVPITSPNQVKRDESMAKVSMDLLTLHESLTELISKWLL